MYAVHREPPPATSAYEPLLARQNNMADDIRFSPFVLAKFIELYKSVPCLWDRKCPDYRVKKQKEEALNKLLQLSKEHYPEATRATVSRKIESIRSCHRKERAKLERQRSRLKDQAAGKKLKSTLWYYDSLSFLNVFGARRSTYRRDLGEEDDSLEKKSNSSDDENDSICINVKKESDDEEDAADDDEPQFEQSMETYSNEYGMASNMVEVSESSSKQYPGFEEDANKSGKRHCTEVEDEYDAIGINVAAKLRNLPSNMRILAEKLINDVLFQAQLNGLNPSTSISTPDPFKQDPM